VDLPYLHNNECSGNKSMFVLILYPTVFFLSAARSSIILDTQHEGALQKIQYLEDDSRYKRTRTEEAIIAEKPQFGRPLRNVEHLPEGLSVHLEATLTPVNDPTMKVEWYCNGRPIPQGE
jgi:hypothetical protein